MIPRIVSVDSRVFSASLRTSDATTANRRPCSPAAADSIAAFSARRWISLAISLMISITFPISCDFSPRNSVFRAMSPTRSLICAIASTPSRPSVVPACATSTDFDAASFTDSAFCAIWRDVRDSSSIVAVTSATDVACCDALAACSWITVMKSEENVPTLAPVSWIWARTDAEVRRHRVEVPGQRPDLLEPLLGDPLPQLAPRHLARALPQTGQAGDDHAW